ncbi:MAG TPA: COX15/CtaA family protein, partial [bacterium]|nr:COX15/CtaA family protein [bacterium]
MNSNIPRSADLLPWRTAIVLVAMTFVLVLMGALVTSNEAGDSVPGWPLAWGQVVPVGHLSGKVIFEYFHRVVAGLVGICSLLLAVLVLARPTRLVSRVLACTALVLVIVQALLGGIRVNLGETHSYGVAMIHAFAAQLFLGTACATLLSLGPRWRGAMDSAAGAGPQGGARGLVALCAGTVAAVLLQILLGAGYRHKVLGVLPHAIDGVLAIVLVALLASAVRRRARVAGDGP